MKRGKLFVKIKATGDGAEKIAFSVMERKIFAKNVKYVKNGCFLTIDAVDEQKFFAISRNMCYNVERIGYTGRFAFFKKLLKKAGAISGAVALITFVYLCDPVVGETEIISTAVELDESGEKEKIIYRAIFTVAVTVK